jgi:hypothetical protein
MEIKRAVILSQYHNESLAAAVSWANIWETARSTITVTMELFGLGVLIDIADRIRISVAANCVQPGQPSKL